MIRLIASIILLCFSFQVNGQQRINRPQAGSPNFDEFRAQVNSTENPDSLLTQYALFARRIVRAYPDSTLALSNEVMNLEQINDFKRRAYKNLILTSYWFRPNPDSALIYSEKALSLFQELGEKDRILELLILQARLQAQSNNYLLSEELYLRALEYSETHSLTSFDKENLLDELTGLYIRVGAVDLALDRYNQLLEIKPLTAQNECNILLKVSNAYKRNEEMNIAKEKLLKCEEAEGLKVGLKLAILRSLSELDRTLGNIDETIRRLEQAVEIEEQINRKDFNTHLFLAKAYLEKPDIQKTNEMILELEKLNIQRAFPPARIDFYLLKTRFLIQVGRVNEALTSVEEAIALAKRLPPTPLLIDAYRIKADILEEKGDYEAAYAIVNKINETNSYVKERSVIAEEAMGKVRFQMRAKSDQLSDVTSQLGTVKTRNALIIFILVLIALYIIYRYRVYYLLREERTRNRIARDLHDDLSGTLSSISFFSEAAKREHEDLNKSGKFLEKIDESAIEAKEKINDIIWAIDPENDDWTAFLTKCRRYAAEMFESKDIEYNIEFSSSLEDVSSYNLRQDLWLVFKEMVTNIVRHSNANKAEIIFLKNGNELSLSVKDNGIGISYTDKSKGNGISNLQYRSKKMNAKLDLENVSPTGTKCELIIPL